MDDLADVDTADGGRFRFDWVKDSKVEYAELRDYIAKIRDSFAPNSGIFSILQQYPLGTDVAFPLSNVASTHDSDYEDRIIRDAIEGLCLDCTRNRAHTKTSRCHWAEDESYERLATWTKPI